MRDWWGGVGGERGGGEDSLPYLGLGFLRFCGRVFMMVSVVSVHNI